MAVPQWLEEGVGEAEGQQILDRFLAQVVVHAQNRPLRERLLQDCVEPARGLEITTEGFFTITRDPRFSPAFVRPATTVGNIDGGIAR